MIYCVKKGEEVVYVGQTIMSLAERKGCHLSQARKGRGGFLGAGVRKHGEAAFVWEKRNDTDSLVSACIEERRLIALLKPRYNQQAGGKSGFEPHNKGVKASAEVCKAISDAAKTRKRTKRGSYSPEHCGKISSAMEKSFARPFRCTETGRVYMNKTEAARDLGIHPGGISAVLMTSTKNKSHKGYTFEYSSAQNKFPLIDLEAR